MYFNAIQLVTPTGMKDLMCVIDKKKPPTCNFKCMSESTKLDTNVMSENKPILVFFPFEILFLLGTHAHIRNNTKFAS